MIVKPSYERLIKVMYIVQLQTSDKLPTNSYVVSIKRAKVVINVILILMNL